MNQNYHRYESYQQRKFREEDKFNSTAGYLIGALLLGVGITISSCHSPEIKTSNEYKKIDYSKTNYHSFNNRLNSLEVKLR